MLNGTSYLEIRKAWGRQSVHSLAQRLIFSCGDLTPIEEITPQETVSLSSPSSPPASIEVKSSDPEHMLTSVIDQDIAPDSIKFYPEAQAEVQVVSTDVKAGYESEEGLDRDASLVTHIEPHSDSRQPLQSRSEAAVTNTANKVFARGQIFPMTFHVLAGPSQADVETMIKVSPTWFEPTPSI